MQQERNTENTKGDINQNNEENLNNSDHLLHIDKKLYDKDTAATEDEILDSVVIAVEYEAEEDLSELLKQQVNEELKIEQLIQNENSHTIDIKKRKNRKIRNRILLTVGITLAVLLIFSIWLVGTKSGRKMIYSFAGNLIYDQMDNVVDTPVTSVKVPENEVDQVVIPKDEEEEIVIPEVVVVEPRQEEYVSNYLIFGIEEIKNASNTDSIMIASINTKDNTIKLISLLRDTYIDIPGEKPTKLNAIYARGGASKLVNTIEEFYRIKIDGYAHINFEAFENIVDRLGGISIELGEEEAHYLNTTNYISNPKNRNVEPGMFLLNGNQALGYCRVRKCVTLGGANDDYGRTLRQRRVLSAIFNQYKKQNIFSLLSTMDDILDYIKTNVTANQIEKSLEAIVENKITTMNTLRIPANGTFEALDEWNGIEDPLVVDWDKTIMELYQFIYLDTEEEAAAALAEQRK